jgi:hypothetical protein
MRSLLARASSPEGVKIVDLIFSLKGAYGGNGDDWCDHCGQIEENPVVSNRRLKELMSDPVYFDAALRTMGYLIAYAQALGIRDLNYENLVFSESGMHLIDAEVAFEEIQFASQTHAFGTSPEYSIVSGMAPFWYFQGQIADLEDSGSANFFLREESLRVLLQGYFSGWDALRSSRSEIVESVTSFLKEFQETPIRVVLRNSSEYAKKLKFGIDPPRPFLDSELEQMERGDVPYFFYTPKEKTLRYLVKKSGESDRVEIPLGHPLETAWTGISRSCLESLLSEERFGRIEACGAIELVRELSEFRLEAFELVFGDRLICLEGGMIRFSRGDSNFIGQKKQNVNEDGFPLNFKIMEI